MSISMLKEALKAHYNYLMEIRNETEETNVNIMCAHKSTGTCDDTNCPEMFIKLGRCHYEGKYKEVGTEDYLN